MPLCFPALLDSLQTLPHLSFRPNRHYHPSPQVPGRDSYRVRRDGVKRMTSVPPPRRSLIVWKMVNGTTMPAARSSRLRVSTHSTAGRCRQETHKSPSARWNHTLVTQIRWNKSDFNSECLRPRGLSLSPTQDNDLHIAFCATGKGPHSLSTWKRSSREAG